VNTFEVAVLRVLVKRRQPLKFSALVAGFPDSCEDSVLTAISKLKELGYVDVSDYCPEGKVLIVENKRRQVLKLIENGVPVSNEATVPVMPYSEPRSTSSSPSSPIVQPVAIPVSRGFYHTKRISLTVAVVIGLFGLLAAGGLPSAMSPSMQLAANHPSNGQATIVQTNAQTGHYPRLLGADYEYASPNHHTIVILEIHGNQTTVITFQTADGHSLHRQILS
jgi:hypothetical protein